MNEIYKKNYTHIKDIDKYFKYDDKNKQMIFIGDSLEIRIPKRFEKYDLLMIESTIKYLAICDLIIDDTYQAGLYMCAVIESDIGSDLEFRTILGNPYVVMTLSYGDVFIHKTEVIKNQNIVYAIFEEFLVQGKPIYTINYDNIFNLFDQSKSMCDANLSVDHSILEVVFSHLYRKASDKTVLYRFTDMKEDGVLIALKSVNYATTSVTSKVLGPYYNIGLNSSLLVENEEMFPVENILR